MRIAVLADIHGNLPALQAVVAELERLQPDYVILNGDLINAVPFSPEVIDLVRSQDWAVVRGNHEFYYLDLGTERAGAGFEDPTRWGQLHWLAARISTKQGAYLAMLPDERLICLPGTRPMRVAHGVPGRNRVGFFTHQPAASIAAEVANIREETVISAHTHVQVDRQVCVHGDADEDVFADPHSTEEHAAAARTWHVINPGSVGLPLNGDTRAQFAILESVDPQQVVGGWQVTHQQVDYDRRPALAAFAEREMLQAGGAISHLFYWELVTGEPEIVNFFQWARHAGHDPDHAMEAAFRAYAADTRRDAYVRARDPLVSKPAA
ncbi:MAG: metallophosphoesterase [Litorilinea sp.]